MRVYKIYLSIQELVEGEVSVDDIIITGYEEINFHLFLDSYLNDTSTMHDSSMYDSSMTIDLKAKRIDNHMKYGGHFCVKKDDTYILDYDFTGSNPIHDLLMSKLVIKIREDKINNVL